MIPYYLTYTRKYPIRISLLPLVVILLPRITTLSLVIPMVLLLLLPIYI